MNVRALAVVFAAINLAVWCAPASAVPPRSPPGVAVPAQIRGPSPAQSTIGIEGQVILRHRAAEPVQTVPVNDKAPVVVRIADSTPDGEYVLYDLRFIAQYAGKFDLRDCLRRPDGSALTDAPPLPVVIGKLLPEDHQGELIEIAGMSVPRLGGYRAALVAVGAVWLIPPAWLIVRRLMRKAASQPPAGPRPHTLADQLRPLVERAIRADLSTPERAQLEMLLLGYWRERLGLHSVDLDPAQAICRLRENREAGELLTLLEQWLHRPPSRSEAVDIGAMLERYRDAAPVDLGTRHTHSGVPA